MIGQWPCQQLHGGVPPFVYQGVDEYGLCNHPECEPEEAQQDAKVDLQTATNKCSMPLDRH